jgi:hypothetical protein
MSGSAFLRAFLAVVVCSALLLLAAFADAFVRPDYQAHHVETLRSPSGEIEGVSIYDIQPDRSTIEVILTIAIPLLSLAGAAIHVASPVERRKVVVGGGASACVALIALTVIHSFMWRRRDAGYFPGLINIVGWSIVSFAIGAGACGATARWWPNKSLERTREG